jgi:hypothetical protein
VLDDESILYALLECCDILSRTRGYMVERAVRLSVDIAFIDASRAVRLDISSFFVSVLCVCVAVMV